MGVLPGSVSERLTVVGEAGGRGERPAQVVRPCGSAVDSLDLEVEGRHGAGFPGTERRREDDRDPDADDDPATRPWSLHRRGRTAHQNGRHPSAGRGSCRRAPGYPPGQSGEEWLVLPRRVVRPDPRRRSDDSAPAARRRRSGRPWRALISSYSRGMRQRLGIARALVNDPDVVFLDEPTLGLDPSGQVQVLDLIGRIAQDRGATVLLSTPCCRTSSRSATASSS